jgi:hypothetical protein
MRGGAATGGAGGTGAGGRTTGAAGFASTGGAAGREGDAGGVGAAAFCCLPMIAFNTSPGLEMWERSILVLISSGADWEERLGFADAEEPSPLPRKYPRTFSASCSSRELEWVFFSVTPTSGRVSRIALLFTSSSLARSLIRILLIRLFVPPNCPAKSSYQPHGR